MSGFITFNNDCNFPEVFCSLENYVPQCCTPFCLTLYAEKLKASQSPWLLPMRGLQKRVKSSLSDVFISEAGIILLQTAKCQCKAKLIQGNKSTSAKLLGDTISLTSFLHPCIYFIIQYHHYLDQSAHYFLSKWIDFKTAHLLMLSTGLGDSPIVSIISLRKIRSC